jgi:outer membrane receptor protein involved in Fe transport
VLQAQGSNEFEGMISLLYGSSALDGSGAATVPDELEPDFEWFQPALQISGPLIRDKLWFRLSHEHIRRDDPVNVLGQINVSERDQWMHADQLTWQVSPRNKLAFQFQADPLELTNVGISSRVSPVSARTLERGGKTYSVTWTAPISSKLLIDTQAAYQDHETNLLPQTDQPFSYNGCAIFGARYLSKFDIFNELHCANADSGREAGYHPETSQDRRQRFTFRSDVTSYAGRALGATHQVKAGLIVENERYFRDLERRPDQNFYSVEIPFGSTFEAIGYTVARVAVPETSSAKATSTNWALYIEDQIKPTQNVVVSVGLRYDREEIDSPGRTQFDPEAEASYYRDLLEQVFLPSRAISRSFTSYGQIDKFRHDLALILRSDESNLPLGPAAAESAFWPRTWRGDNINLDMNNFSPRLAVAWDPWANGKTRISFSAGRYYDKIVLAIPLLELEPAETNLTFISFPFSADRIFFDSGLLGTFSPAVDARMVDRDLTTPYQDEYALSFEREVSRESSIRVTYLHRNFEDQLQDVDINHATGDKGHCVIPWDFGESSAVEASPGEGAILANPYTGVTYTDTDPGVGDGIIDDCTGIVINEGGPWLGNDREFPDGLPDLYKQNPGWGEILLVGNFNSTTYDALIVEFIRRMYRRWQMNASYTWSEAVGNAEDFDQILGNERILSEDEYGLLSYDQTHVLKVNAVGLLGKGWRLGGLVRWESGLPYSVLESRQTVYGRPPEYQNQVDLDTKFRFRYPTRQRNDQRNGDYWTVDLRVAKDFAISRQVQLQLSGEVFNLLNDDTLIVEDQINGMIGGVRRFGRRWQLGMRLGF